VTGSRREKDRERVHAQKSQRESELESAQKRKSGGVIKRGKNTRTERGRETDREREIARGREGERGRGRERGRERERERKKNVVDRNP